VGSSISSTIGTITPVSMTNFGVSSTFLLLEDSLLAYASAYSLRKRH
jgi:hypothetical protein